VPRIAGVVLLDPVDYPNPRKQDEGEGGEQPPSPPASASCLPLLAALPAASVPVAVAALPYSGVNRYYKSRNTNLCAPPGRDAWAFYRAAATAAESSQQQQQQQQQQSPPRKADSVPSRRERRVKRPRALLMTVPEAGHLQLLESRPALPFAEMCGVGNWFREEQVVDVCSNLVVACALSWLGGGDAVVAEGNEGEEGGKIRERVLLGEREGERGLRPIDPAVAATVTWEFGGG
jgi:hypothetical protein